MTYRFRWSTSPSRWALTKCPSLSPSPARECGDRDAVRGRSHRDRGRGRDCCRLRHRRIAAAARRRPPAKPPILKPGTTPHYANAKGENVPSQAPRPQSSILAGTGNSGWRGSKRRKFEFVPYYTSNGIGISTNLPRSTYTRRYRRVSEPAFSSLHAGTRPIEAHVRDIRLREGEPCGRGKGRMWVCGWGKRPSWRS